MSPLAKDRPDRPGIVERFHVIVAGSELGNGYSELNDPLEQARRFEEQQAMREAGDAEAQMPDPDFVEALEYGMPPACGFGMSERVFAFFMDKSVRECQIFPLLRPLEPPANPTFTERQLVAGPVQLAAPGGGVTGTIRAETSSPSSMSSTPMVPWGWRRRSVGEPGLKIRCPSPAWSERDVRVTEDDQLRARGTGGASGPGGRPPGRSRGSWPRQPAQVQLQRVRRAPGGDVRAVVVAPDRPDRRVGGQLVQAAAVHTSPACRIRSAPRRCPATARGQDRQRRGACVSDSTITFTGPSCPLPTAPPSNPPSRQLQPHQSHRSCLSGVRDRARAGTGASIS